MRGRRGRAGALPQHGHGHPGRGAGLGRVLQRRGRHVLGQPAAGQRARRALRRQVLGPRQRDVRRLADRPAHRGGVRDRRPPVGQGAQAARPGHPPGQLRPDRDGRLGPRRHRRPRAARRLSQHSPVHRVGGLLVQRARAALRRAGPVGGRRADRPGPVRAADRSRDLRRLRRVERLVPDRRRAAGGALQPGRRARRRDLPQRVRAPVLDGADGQPGPAGQRHRAHRHLRRRDVPARASTTRSG